MDKTSIKTNTKPNGILEWVVLLSSQYLSHLKYQQDAWYISSINTDVIIFYAMHFDQIVTSDK